jgi:3-oxoacyl-[acyl-carrier protein] reductase
MRALEATAADVREASMLIFESMVTLTHAFLPGMLAQGWGRIVAVGSSGISAPIPGLVLSNSLRNALWGYLKTLATEVANAGVTVNMVSPGRIDTDRIRTLDRHRSDSTERSIEETKALALSAIPAGRYGRVEELGAVAAFLCSTQAAYVTGSNVRVDGGMVNSL